MAEELEDLLEPRKKYLNQFEREHLENTKAYFEELVRQANVDPDLNKKTCQKYYALEKEIVNLKRKSAGNNALFVFLIILFIVLLLGGIILSSSVPDLMAIGIVVAIASIALMVFFIIRHRQKSKLLAKKISEMTEEMEMTKREADNQMAPLNILYEWNTYNILMNKTLPIITMDRILDMNKYYQLINHFKWDDEDQVNKSTLLAQSGSILGNPFIIYRECVQTMYNKTYTGSITITYKERVSDGKGGYTYRTRSQQLTASISKPAPTYSNHTRLVYGNEAAPHLSFSRNPIEHGYDEASLKRHFKNAEKNVDKYAKEHPNFTPLGNDMFEDFFGGLDRDHEVEYRLLFTPLAQKAMLDILTNANPYGDDFSFYKTKMINTIISGHMQHIDLDGSPHVFYNFDLERARENFINLNVNYFRSVYFDLAPLMAIPLYQQYPTNEYIFKRDKNDHFAHQVPEMEANRYDENYFKPNECITPLILKNHFVGKSSSADMTMITAHGFKGIPHTDYVSKMGKDGRSHDIPIDWIEYVPVTKNTPFVVQDSELTRRDYINLMGTNEYKQFLSNNVRNNAILCSRGLFSFINNNGSYHGEELEKAIKTILNK